MMRQLLNHQQRGFTIGRQMQGRISFSNSLKSQPRHEGGCGEGQTAKITNLTCKSSQNAAGKGISGYMEPPQGILDIVDQEREPLYSFSPTREQVVEIRRPAAHPSIIEFTKDELKLGGIRIDPEGFCRSRGRHYTGLAIADRTDDLSLPFGKDKKTDIEGIPDGYGIKDVSWSRDGRYIAFTARKVSEDVKEVVPPSELWVAEVSTFKARRLCGDLNTVMLQYSWVDEDTIIVGTIPKGIGKPPERANSTFGPRIEENIGGKKSQTRTYQDLLKDEHDENLFSYYCNSSLVSINVSSGEVRNFLDESRVYTSISPSPSGEYVLASWLEKPWSYAVPCGRFPKVVQLLDKKGKLIREMCRLPLALHIPLAFDSCREGPRGIAWRDDRPHDIYWAECQDGGDPNVDASPRDIVYTLHAPDANWCDPSVIASTTMRYSGIIWGDSTMALLYESEWKTRRSKTWIISPDGMKDPELLFDLNYEDSYNDPGTPVLRRNENGTYTIAEIEKKRQILLQGGGASPDGSKPFLDLLDLETGYKKRIWQSSPPYYENISTILSDKDPGIISLKNLEMLARRETEESPPQFSIVKFDENADIMEDRQISNFPHPYPSLIGMKKKILQYKRKDGVDLNATLYLPPGYNPDSDEKLKCILWAYPREFKSKDTAGQLRKSPHQFVSIGSTSPIMMVSQGYAVLDGPSFPIFAEGDEEPNDSYIEQLTSSAQAAIEELGRQGCIDIARVAVGGHSYGAFMAAGLLAHAPTLFRCGIARSGAYNRTMTPFGFQAEERTLWQALDTYTKMSPFMNADKIERPLLLIHGEADNNPGTFPMQSERMYAALKGHGTTTRLVILPYESHGYAARESVLHCLAETYNWLEEHC